MNSCRNRPITSPNPEAPVPAQERGTPFVNAVFGRISPAAKTAEARRFRHRRQHAFSLVEVVLALGIISAVFIPLLGMLSIGFSSFKESNVDVKASLIAQKVLAAAQLVPYGKLQGATKYLNYDGNEVSQTESVFTVTIAPDNAPTSNPLQSPSLTTMRVIISGPGVNNRQRIFASTIANLGD